MLTAFCTVNCARESEKDLEMIICQTSLVCQGLVLQHHWNLKGSLPLSSSCISVMNITNGGKY
jgi:hypothetical protein